MYPRYYEDAAHMAQILTRQGLVLKDRPSPHILLLVVSMELEMAVKFDNSHYDTGRVVVSALSELSLDMNYLKRLYAIGGTLVGNFMTRHGRRTA